MALPPPFRPLLSLEQVGSEWHRVGNILGGLDRLVQPRPAACAHAIDRPVSRDRHQPGDRAGAGCVERAGLPPNGDVNLLEHVLGLASVIQYTDADAKKLRGGHVVDEAKRRPVAAGDAIQSRGELLAPSVGIHGVFALAREAREALS
jgi:hypothetical protein